MLSGVLLEVVGLASTESLECSFGTTEHVGIFAFRVCGRVFGCSGGIRARVGRGVTGGHLFSLS